MTASAPVALDDFDRHILARVQRDAHCKAEAIASEIGLSASAVQRRLKRLRERGVIRAEVAVLDPAAVGGLLTLLCGMAIERENYAACCCAAQNLMLYLWRQGIGVKWTTGGITRPSR